MREILFRGKRLADGKWICGYYFEQDMADGMRSYIRTLQADRFGTDFAVDPDTVGQYTGLTDTFNEKIFVGDIVRYKTDALTLSYEYVGIVEWDRVNPSMCIRYQRNSYLEDIEYDFVKCGIASIEVMGNKWDNPDLLKGGEQ